MRKRVRLAAAPLALAVVIGGLVLANTDNRVELASATGDGPVKLVIVKYKDVEPVTDATSVDFRQAEIAKANSTLVNEMKYEVGYKELTRVYDNLPMAAFLVDEAGEAALRADATIESVAENQYFEPFANLASPITAVDGSPVTGFTDGAATFNGSGYSIVIADTGVDKNHPALAGRVVAEACFGENREYGDAVVESVCPGKATESFASGAASTCGEDLCGHGTMVAAAAAMSTRTLDLGDYPEGRTLPTSGVATGANIIAVQISKRVIPKQGYGSICGGEESCITPTTDLILAAYNWAISKASDYNIAALNLSAGSSPFAANTTQCQDTDYNAFKVANAGLIGAGIAPVVATGNSGDISSYANKISSPACVEGSIAVGATNIAGTTMASYSNNGPNTTLLAPGGDVVWDSTLKDPNKYDLSSDLVICRGFWGERDSWDTIHDFYEDLGYCPMPVFDAMQWLPVAGTNQYAMEMGTSFAAPMVAGAFAVLKQKAPEATVAELLQVLQSTGKPVTDSRDDYTVGAKKLIQVDAALEALVGTGTPTTPPPTEPPTEQPPAENPIEHGFVGSDRHEPGSTSNIVFRVAKDVSLFTSLKVNGALLASANYTVESGSTVITLKPEYLNTLVDGVYTLSALFSDSTTYTGAFYIVSPNSGGGTIGVGTPGVPNTAEAITKFVSVNALPLVAAALAVVVGTFTYLIRKLAKRR